MSTVRLVWDVIERMREDKNIPWQVRSHLEDIRSFDEYADGRDAPKGIVAANWNEVNEYDHTLKMRVPVPYGDVMPRLCALFEHYGVKIEWSDCVTDCSGCYRCIQTEPDCYSWQPEFIVGDGEILCSDCVADDAERFLQEYEGNARNAWNMPNIDPADHGYVRINKDSYESGWHPGQTDDPKKIAKELDAKGVSRYLFCIDSVGQFDSRWSVFVHKDDMHILNHKKKATDPCYASIEPTEITADEYYEARGDYMGFCVECKEFTRDSTEPDAENYNCEQCGNDTVIGAENALIEGKIEVGE